MKKTYLFLIISVFCFFSCSQNKFDAVSFFINSGNLEKAELILKKMNKKEKNSFDYNYLTGILLTKKTVAGYKRDALNSFLKANEYNLNNYFNNLMISKMYIEVNDLENAEVYALKTEKIISGNTIPTYEDDVYYLLAKIYFKKQDYEKALKNINLSFFQNDKFIFFFKTEIIDLCNGTDLLDILFEKYKSDTLLSDEMQFNYLNYLFLRERINDAKNLSDEFLKEKSLLLNYYGYLSASFIDMLNKRFESAKNNIKKSYDYIVEDSLFLKYKMKVFYSFCTEKNLIKIFNSFLIYKFFYEKTEQEEITAKEDLLELYKYFKDDIYFKLLEKYVLK